MQTGSFLWTATPVVCRPPITSQYFLLEHGRFETCCVRVGNPILLILDARLAPCGVFGRTSRGYTTRRPQMSLLVLSIKLALLFTARRVEPSLSLVYHEVEVCALTWDRCAMLVVNRFTTPRTS